MAKNSNVKHALYPDDLLKAPPEKKLDFFMKSIVEHDEFVDARKQMEARIEDALPGTLILLVGPAGIGKSALGGHITTKINTDFFLANPDDKHTIPAAMIEAWAPETDRFDWHDLYEMLLTALQAPLIDASLPEVRRKLAGIEVWQPLITSYSRPSLRTIRQRLRRAVQMRSPDLIFIDEASNILISPHPQRVKRQGNTLRSIVNKSNARLAISGAYDLYALATKSGQLSRRAEVLHFKPYLRSEKHKFAKALFSLQQAMPVEGRCDLSKYADQLFDQSLGSVGHLKRILAKALSNMYRNNRTEMDLELLSYGFYKAAQLQTLRCEMFDGYWTVEGRLHPDDGRKLAELPSVMFDIATDRLSEGPSEEPTATAQRRGRKDHVGKPLPDRKPLEKKRD